MPKSTATSASALREERRRASGSSSSLIQTSALARLLLDKKRVTFLTKLFAHLQDHHPNPGTHDIRWCPDDKTLAVTDADKFASTVCKDLYKHSNFESFIRQMDIYGFSRCRPLTDGKLGEHLWIHEQFDRSTTLAEALTYKRRAGPKPNAGDKRKTPSPSSKASRTRVTPYHGWGGRRPGLDILERMTADVQQPVAPQAKEEEQQAQEDFEINMEDVVAPQIEEPVSSPVEDLQVVEDQLPASVPIATKIFVDAETASVVSDVGSTRSFGSLSAFSSSRPSSPSVNLLGVSTLPLPRSRLNSTAPTPTPIHVPYRRSISLTSPLASFAASRALRGTPLTISAPLASSFQHHRSPIPSPLDPPSFPFPTQNQLQSPPSSPRILIASENSALRTPLPGRWELEEEVGEMSLGRGRVVSNGSGRRATLGSFDRLPGIYESVRILGSPWNAMARRTSDVGRIGQECCQSMSPPPTHSHYSPPSPQYSSSSSVLFGSSSGSVYQRLQSPPYVYYEPSSATYSHSFPHQYPPQYAPIEGYQQQQQQQQQQQHPRFATSTSRGTGRYAPHVRRVQSSGNLIGRKSSQGW